MTARFVYTSLEGRSLVLTEDGALTVLSEHGDPMLTLPPQVMRILATALLECPEEGDDE